MSHLTTSALEQHYLEAILPHPLPPQQHFLKNKDFYKPQQFIWNNPHRTSDRMFQFYHAYNHHYDIHKAPLIEQMEQQDREQEQQARISRLIDFRNKTRQQFYQTQKQRKTLQNKAQQRNQHNEQEESSTFQTLQPHCQTTSSIKDDAWHNKEKTTRHKTQLKNQPQSQRLIRIEETYKQGVKRHDLRDEEIQRLIKEQNRMYHTKIRSEFLSRKITNDSQSRLCPQGPQFSNGTYSRNKKNTIS